MIAIVDYGLGNLASVLNMVRKTGAQAEITSDPERIRVADKLILPGVGAFDVGMRNIEQRGLRAVLQERVISRGTPVLGICLGMQLFSASSSEGTEPGLGWIDARTTRLKLPAENPDLRVPHMGWNQLADFQRHPLFKDFDDPPRFYFVHSYHVSCADPSDVLATVRYGIEITACVARGNILGTQFHPEKSHKHGLRLLSNFAAMS